MVGFSSHMVYHIDDTDDNDGCDVYDDDDGHGGRRGDVDDYHHDFKSLAPMTAG